jgi:hypothetical protein
LNEISQEDAQFIEDLIIKDSPEGLKESHRFLLYTFTPPHKAKKVLEEQKRQIEEAGQRVDEAVFRESMAFLDTQIIELSENYHTSIEHLFQPILKDLKAGNLKFFEEQEKRFAFYYGLSVRYSRTNHIKACRREMSKEHFEHYLHLANVITHLGATNVGSNLMGARESQNVHILDNASDVPFVTADQPVINISARPKDFNPPAKFELYYPLSPTKAMMLLEPNSAHRPYGGSVSAIQAHHYNLLMAAHSFRQVYSNSNAELEAIKTELPAFLESL